MAPGNPSLPLSPFLCAKHGWRGSISAWSGPGSLCLADARRRAQGRGANHGDAGGPVRGDERFGVKGPDPFPEAYNAQTVTTPFPSC